MTELDTIQIAEKLGQLDGRVSALERRFPNGNGGGPAGLTRAERITLISGAPLVLAALIAALAQLVRGGA